MFVYTLEDFLRFSCELISQIIRGWLWILLYYLHIIKLFFEKLNFFLYHSCHSLPELNVFFHNLFSSSASFVCVQRPSANSNEMAKSRQIISFLFSQYLFILVFVWCREIKYFIYYPSQIRFFFNQQLLLRNIFVNDKWNSFGKRYFFRSEWPTKEKDSFIGHSYWTCEFWSARNV